MAITDKITLNSVSQEIELSDYFGREPSPEEALEFAEAARDRMIERTQSGTQRGGGRFKAYSPEYADFKGSSEVDLTLFGDMLSSVQTRISGSRVDLYVDPNDDLNTKKSFNHHTGDTLPSRPFFGITDNEAQSIARQVKRQNPELTELFRATQISNQDIADILATIGLFGGS